MRRTTIWGSAAAAAALATTALVAAPAASADAPTLRVLASGFALPTHLAFGPHGGLFVADAAAGTISKVGHGSSRVVASLGEFTPGLDVRRDGSLLVAASVSGGPGPQSPTHLYRVSKHGGRDDQGRPPRLGAREQPRRAEPRGARRAVEPVLRARAARAHAGRRRGRQRHRRGARRRTDPHPRRAAAHHRRRLRGTAEQRPRARRVRPRAHRPRARPRRLPLRLRARRRGRGPHLQDQRAHREDRAHLGRSCRRSPASRSATTARSTPPRCSPTRSSGSTGRR